ncbi:hypothetical protein PAXINDRAFT_14316 [Paxillus involutus ATCC 200175]|uniref:Uncharacterized protein n=1 Tax=Paxillus involutus ATCC 200175 TaxID=664439 RepID=A0A0C9TZG0_PAXIN|nr:hypothetical protein PAXINDRAFT_14316 [Paxillus involutus ATCC 200175]
MSSQTIRGDIFLDWTNPTEISFQYNPHEADGGQLVSSRHTALGLCQSLTVFDTRPIGYIFRVLPNGFKSTFHASTLKIRKPPRNSQARAVLKCSPAGDRRRHLRRL